MDEKIKNILHHFCIEGELISYTPLGNGHINSTFLCITSDSKYVLQKINNNVFKDVGLLMNNYQKVTEYLLHKKIETIELIKTKTGETFLKYSDGFYRLYKYIDHSIWYEKITNLDLVYKAAKAFGNLHKELKGFPARELGETIPNFHNTYQRYENLLNAIKENKVKRVNSCLKEIELIKSFEQEYAILGSSIKGGLIPLAVTHNDPKINNVLFDETSGDIRAVIDLDTIMPGSYLFDYGDALRSLFTGDNEDSEDLSQLKVNFEIFKAYTDGYISEMKKVLTKREIELMPISIFLLTIECGIRFLEDYIRGDIYFKIKRPDHNLIRARTQLTLACDIHKNLGAFSDIIDQIL